MLKLIVVRHGETKHNAAGIIQGQFDSELSEEGRKQIFQLGIDLKNEPIDLILSSDLSRCVETTLAIAKFHPHCPIIYDPRLRERNNGVFQGKPREEYKLHVKNNLLSPLDFKPEGGESFREFYERCRLLLNDIKDRYNCPSSIHNNILISSHSGVISCFDLIISDHVIDDYDKKKKKVGNAYILRYEL